MVVQQNAQIVGRRCKRSTTQCEGRQILLWHGRGAPFKPKGLAKTGHRRHGQGWLRTESTPTNQLTRAQCWFHAKTMSNRQQPQRLDKDLPAKRRRRSAA